LRETVEPVNILDHRGAQGLSGCTLQMEGYRVTKKHRGQRDFPSSIHNSAVKCTGISDNDIALAKPVITNPTLSDERHINCTIYLVLIGIPMRIFGDIILWFWPYHILSKQRDSHRSPWKTVETLSGHGHVSSLHRQRTCPISSIFVDSEGVPTM
jgi:hypothetical protein